MILLAPLVPNLLVATVTNCGLPARLKHISTYVGRGSSNCSSVVDVISRRVVSLVPANTISRRNVLYFP